VKSLRELVHLLGRGIKVLSQIAGRCRRNFDRNPGLVAVFVPANRRRLEHDGDEVLSAFYLGNESHSGNWKHRSAGLRIDFCGNVQITGLRIFDFKAEHSPIVSEVRM
jgi:hypothetical protein